MHYGVEMFIRRQPHVIQLVDGMSRMISTDNSLFSLQLTCYYISSDYRSIHKPASTDYLKDIFDDE